jgi:hypothetical protein
MMASPEFKKLLEDAFVHSQRWCVASYSEATLRIAMRDPATWVAQDYARYVDATDMLLSKLSEVFPYVPYKNWDQMQLALAAPPPKPGRKLLDEPV